MNEEPGVLFRDLKHKQTPLTMRAERRQHMTLDNRALVLEYAEAAGKSDHTGLRPSSIRTWSFRGRASPRCTASRSSSPSAGA
jgi:hypothetical protein